jgi:hypothetical protein
MCGAGGSATGGDTDLDSGVRSASDRGDADAICALIRRADRRARRGAAGDGSSRPCEGQGSAAPKGGRAVAVASSERSRRGGPKRTPVREQLPATQTADRRNHNVPQSGPSTRRDEMAPPAPGSAARIRPWRGRRSAWSIGFSEIEPAHRTPQSTAQDEMGSAGSSMPGAPRRYAAGNARCTRAPTESGDPHVPLALAMVTAVPQLGIERVEHVGVKSGHLDRPDRRFR